MCGNCRVREVFFLTSIVAFTGIVTSQSIKRTKENIFIVNKKIFFKMLVTSAISSLLVHNDNPSSSISVFLQKADFRHHLRENIIILCL